MANQKANLAAVYLTNFMQTKFFVFSHRRLKFDLSFHTCRFRSCLVRIVHFAKMLCHDMNGPNILEDAPHHEFYRFKWVGSMITCVRPFSFFGKETVIHSPTRKGITTRRVKEARKKQSLWGSGEWFLSRPERYLQI